MRILAIEDNKDLAFTLKERLGARFVVDLAFTGKDGIYKAQITDYDLFLIDLMLPDTTGIEICKTLRSSGINVPILMLTARKDLDFKVSSLDIGADDYLTKPFKFAELSARIRALLRRGSELPYPNTLTLDNLVLDTVRRQVLVNGKEIPLRKKEFNLLEHFMRNPRRVLSSEFLLERVWDIGLSTNSNTARVHVSRLRKKLQRVLNKEVIKTVHGLGYKLEV